jgi:ribonuclease PH
VGIANGTPILDLNYEEDSKADVDMNLIMTGTGRLVEIQGTAEGEPFSERDLERMVDLGRLGIRRLVTQQRKALGLKSLP